MSPKQGIPREFEALGLDVDAVDETGVPWAFEAMYDDDATATWSQVLVKGWVLATTWELVDGTVRLAELRVRRAGADTSASDGTTKMIARLRLGAVYYNVRRLFRWPALGAAMPDAWVEAIERDGLGVPRPGRPGGELLLCAKWAEKYDDARQRDSRRPVARLVKENPGETAAAIRARLTRARELGLLTAAGIGKAGGHLTPKAKRILKEGS